MTRRPEFDTCDCDDRRRHAPRAGGEGGSPETRFAKSGDAHIAYQVVGAGPLDLVYVPGWVSNVALNWGEPCLILFDKRGTGLSDRVPDQELPTLEQRMDDVRAVLDAVGSERTALLGVSEGGSMCALFAATYPSRTEALVMYGSCARRRRTDDYPELEEYVASSVGGYWHPVGTCKMGIPSEPEAVVNASGRLMGFENVYVADASIMPTIPRANTQLAVIAIAERISELLRER